MAEQSSYTVEQLAEDQRKSHVVLVEENHVPATQDGTLPSHQFDVYDKTSGIDGDAGDWTENGDGTNYPATSLASEKPHGLEEKSDDAKKADEIGDALPLPEVK